MIEQDTIKLLRECDAGVKMGTSTIEDVLDHVKDTRMQQTLIDCKSQHEKLKGEIEAALSRFHDSGKDPNPMAKGMSWFKANVMIGMDESDAAAADLITDGCNMGIKSLNRYLNQYEAADESAKTIAKKLFRMEEKLVTDLREFL